MFNKGTNISIKNRIMAVILAVFMILASSVIMTETGYADTLTGTVLPANGVNVRTHPGTAYDIVCSLVCGSRVTVTGSNNGGDGYEWFCIKTSDGQVGYVRSDLLKVEKTTGTTVPVDKPGDSGDISQPEPDSPVMSDTEFDKYLSDQGFPKSYKTYLKALHEKYPRWIFKAANTGLDWNTVIQKESILGRSLVSHTSIASWKSWEEGAYDRETGTWKSYDSGGWNAASTGIIEYYMDPRNFLTESGIFQFLTHSFDANTQTVNGLKKLTANTFLANPIPEDDGYTAENFESYSDLLLQAGKNAGVNPYVLAAMIIVEQGSNGRGGSISGTVSGYEGYYNYFNIGAYQTVSLSAVQKGLNYASSTTTSSSNYMRPWNTRAASIYGGAQYYYNVYVSKNKNTLYLKKWNVMNGVGAVGQGQYMTNVQGAESEAAQLKKAYNDVLDGAITFVIPVYTGMPSKACPKPTGTKVELPGTETPADTPSTDGGSTSGGDTKPSGNESQTPETPDKANLEAAKAYMNGLAIQARSTKLAPNRIKVTINADVEYVKMLGYDVQYLFYRSEKKSSGYKKMIFKLNNNTYTNTSGVRGTKYYYKAKLQLLDSAGNVICETPLKQCTYASRTFGI